MSTSHMNGPDMSANVASSSKIKQYWEFFFAAETGTYEKTSWLDLLLAEFLVQLKEGVNPKDIIAFCPVSGVVTLVGCELLCGIHRVTSSINAQYIPPTGYTIEGQLPALEHSSKKKTDDEEDARIGAPVGPFAGRSSSSSLQTLHKYLLKGTAWRCLVLLRSLGVEGLSCGRQLCSVLVWLCGELSSANSAPAHGANPHLPRHHRSPDHPPIHQLFSNKIWMKQKLAASQGVKSSPSSSDRPSSCRVKRKVKMEYPEEHIVHGKSNVGENQTSDSEHLNDDLQAMNQTLAVKVRVTNDDFTYFESPLKNQNDEIDHSIYSDPFCTPKKYKPKPEDFINDKHREIIDSEITPYEFNLIVIDLLQALCRAECNTCGSEGLQISVQCINFSLRNLCALQFGSSPVSSVEYTTDEISQLKSALIELLIISLDKVLVRQDLSAKVINNGILPMLLRLLEDVTFKVTMRLNNKTENCIDSEGLLLDKSESLNIVKFVFGIGYSITAFFFCLLMQCRNLDKLRDFTEQFKLYGECQKGALLKQCIVLILKIPGVDPEVSITLSKKLIGSIGRLTSGMKRIRSEVVHSATCPRSRHKVCRERVAAGMHHHHKILGESSAWPGVTPACCVSLLYGVLTSLSVEESVCSRGVLRSKLLHVMLQCGTCCCFPPAYLMENIVRLMLTHSGVASSCLSLLEHTVYGELGASILKTVPTDHLPCATCEHGSNALRSLLSVDEEEDSHRECSPINDSLRKYCLSRDTGPETRSSWAFLIHYNSLLQLHNHNNVLHSTVSHLLRVTPKCKHQMKYELLFSVIYPTFIVAKHRYIIRHEEAAYFLTVSCLNIFATLLNTISFAEQFIRKGGLSYVLELVALSEFSKQCCSILEIAIIVEIWKLQKQTKYSPARSWRDVSSLASLRMMIRSLQDVTNKCYKVFKIKLPAKEFQILSDLSREKVEFHSVIDVKQYRDDRSLAKIKITNTTSPVLIQNKPASEYESSSHDCVEDYVEVLKNVWTFWKTCAGLCLYSPYFRKYIVNESIFLESYGVLKVLLYYVCKCQCNPTETRMLIKVLESLLTIQFSVSDVTMSKSKEITMEILRETFLSETVLSSDGAVLKSICEMLIRVATTSASSVQVMPPVNKAKLPPLLCAEETSSVESSTEEGDEDNAELAGPYMSEASEPSFHTPDDGYEADVEVSKMDVFASRHPYISGMKSPDTMANLNAEMTEVECNEYTKSGAVTHPELCVMVVDILTQLIQKLLVTSEGPGDAGHKSSVGAVGVSLARACCMRLSAALSRPQHSSPSPSPSPSATSSCTIIQRLLTGTAAQLLTHRSQELQELQRSILELVHVLASQSVSPAELVCYLQLFTAPAPPVDILLAALSRLLHSSQNNMPDFILTFPVQRYHTSDASSTESSTDISHLMLNSITSQSQQAEETARLLNDQHLQAGIISPWSCWGLRCGIEGVNWGLWMQGFAATLWLRPQDQQTSNPPSSSADSSSYNHHDDSDSDSMSEWGIIEEWRDQVEHAERARDTPQQKKSACGAQPALHLMSLGHESLVLETWMHVKSGLLKFKLSRPDSKSNKILSETTVESNIPPHQWNFVAFNVKEIVKKRKIHIQITLFVNGRECETAILPIQGILVRKAMPTSLLVGHSVASLGAAATAAGVYHLSGLSLFRAPLLNNYNVLFMMAHGPNATVLNSCQVGYQSPNFASLITPELLASNVDWDQVYEMSSSNMRDLQDNLLLTFSAQSPTIMNLYHQTVSLPTVFSGRNSGGLTGSSLSGPGPSAAIPETLLVVWSGPALPGRYRGIPPAVFMLGGPDVFLYLFARVVELGGTAEQQACALSLLLQLCYADNRLYSMLCEDDCLSMLQTVIASTECHVSHHMLKALLDAACSTPVLTTASGRFYVMTRCDAVLVEPKLLIAIIRAWRDLEKPQVSTESTRSNTDVDYPPSTWMYERTDARNDTSGGLIGTLFLCMHVLLRDDHPHRTFNAYQMNRVNIIQHLLLFCKERFLNSEHGVLSDSVSCSLVELIRALLGEPLLLCHLALLTDFLVLMHQASETFVTHSRSNFYFLLTSDSQSVSEAALMALSQPVKLKRKSRKSQRKKRTISENSDEEAAFLMREFSITKSSTRSRSTPLSQNSDDVLNDNSVNVMKEGVLVNESLSTKDKWSISSGSPGVDTVGSHVSEPECLSVDSVKLNKGITNMQIKHDSQQKSKRRRRSKRSSVSVSESNTTCDNSEAPLVAEETGGGVSPIEQQVLTNEYVVIDSDEVDKSTVQMFSSGIFHQTRVRAGAAPGWAACEGLLLLLRDTICVMPDTMLNQVLGVVVQTETLLVLGNHKEASVRTGVVRVVCALTQRCSADDMRKWEGSLYFSHLANQISLYPASYELVTAAVTLITKCDASLEDQLEENVWTDVTEKWLIRAPPLLALLPCALHDIPLAHNVTIAVKKIIDKSSLKLLNELGVCEVVVRCLRIIGAISDLTFEGRDLILEDLRSLIVRVALKALTSQHHLQILSELHYQLTYVETMEAHQAHKEWRTCHVVSVVRDTQCALYEAQLHCLEEKLNTTYVTHANTSNYFATVLTSAVVSITPDAAGALGAYHNLSKSELAARHRSVLTKAVTFLITRDSNHIISTAEVALAERLFVVLVNAVTGSSPGLRPKWWVSVSGGDWPSTLQQMFQWILSPNTYSEVLKVFALRYIYHAPHQLQHLLTPNDPTGQRKLAVYLVSILKLVHANPSPLLETSITDWIRNWALQTQAQLADRVDSNTLADEARHFASDDQERVSKLLTPYTTINKSVFNKDGLANKLTESAMSITRQVVDTQNTERKGFMEHLRRCQSETVACTQKWQKLIDTYTHEHAIWHNEDSYPASWELDPTEGPGRVRVRLRRCHLNIDKRFLKEALVAKTEVVERKAPLSYLLVSPQSVMHNGLLERLHMNESVHHMSRVIYVTVTCEQPGELLLSDRCIHFIAESGESEASSEVKGALSWSLDAVTSVVTRRWCLRERAIELFLYSGHAHLIAFHNADEMNAFLKALNTMRLPNRSESETLTEAMNLWRNGSLTNWEYLMRLNGWGGRSYNDLMQYPVLPFILADYTSKILDLTSPASFRDLRKPMAVQDRKNETHYINNYNYLKQARREGSCLITGVNKEPYHYGSHYSNSGTVLHFLVRLPPFTRLFLNYQDNNFDIPDRTFHSLQTTWRLTSCDSTTDVKELIPEFFYLPEFFNNSEGLNLGMRQCGVMVNDVELPPWAINARLFTLVHRQALESSYVTENLPHWIDLVFGYKQTGQAAVDAINVFHPATYYGFEPSSIADSVERNAWETMVRTYGQTPRQLLRHPHPHPTTDLYNTPNNTMAVSCVVEGARWGWYCGSPACPAPALLLSRSTPYVQRLSVLAAPRAVAATTRASIVLALSAAPTNRLAGSGSGSAVPYAMALLTWGHSDGMVRLKQRKDLPPEILMQVPGIDSITTVSTSCLMGGCTVWVGHASGRLLVLRPRSPAAVAPPHAAPPRLFRRHPLEMRAHTDAIIDIYVCTSFGIAVSASRDGLIVVWDLNKLSYVRTIPNGDKLSISSVCVSETLCDIVTVHQIDRTDVYREHKADRKAPSKHKSLLRVHTVNASFVGCVKVLEKVMCVCYSTAAEGVSVNCIAAGLDTGGVRLYSSWDLRPLTYISSPTTAAGLVSITYSVDSQQLFAATADGTVLVWESSATKSTNIRILSSLSIF